MVGKKTDISIIRYMFAWLSSECQRLSNFEVKGQGRIISASYCHGFVNGIATQLATSRVEVQKQASSASIIKIDARENEARIAMYKLHSNLRTVRTNSQSKIDSNAFSMGKAKGVGMHLGSSFGASGRVNLLNK